MVCWISLVESQESLLQAIMNIISILSIWRLRKSPFCLISCPSWITFDWLYLKLNTKTKWDETHPNEKNAGFVSNDNFIHYVPFYQQIGKQTFTWCQQSLKRNEILLLMVRWNHFFRGWNHFNWMLKCMSMYWLHVTVILHWCNFEFYCFYCLFLL